MSFLEGVFERVETERFGGRLKEIYSGNTKAQYSFG